MIIKVLTSLVTRDVDAFVNFIEHLRDKLDALIIKHSADIGKVQAYIDEVKDEAEAEVAHIEAEAAALIQDARDYAAHEVTAAETEIATIKAKIERVKNAVGAVSAI